MVKSRCYQLWKQTLAEKYIVNYRKCSYLAETLPHSPSLLTLPAFPLIVSCMQEHLLKLDLITLTMLLFSLQYLSLLNHIVNTPNQPLTFHLGYCSYVFSGYYDIFIAKQYIEEENLLRLTISTSSTPLKWETLQQDSRAGAEQRLQH